jgi:hypothetical protein
MLAEEAAQRPWTEHGAMLSFDRAVIAEVVGHDLMAGRIFVTGEASEDYLGEDAAAFLEYVNEAYYSKKFPKKHAVEPLFTDTRHNTVKMTRFVTRDVWTSMPVETLAKLIEAENARMGINFDPWNMNSFDYYKEAVDALRKEHGATVAIPADPLKHDAFYHAVYLSCLLLFDKPGYMNVPVAEHFAQPEAAEFLKTVQYADLDETEQRTVQELRDNYGVIQALTNPEVHFILDCYDTLKDGMRSLARRRGRR